MVRDRCEVRPPDMNGSSLGHACLPLSSAIRLSGAVRSRYAKGAADVNWPLWRGALALSRRLGRLGGQGGDLGAGGGDQLIIGVGVPLQPPATVRRFGE
jgi:hypothetical protein